MLARLLLLVALLALVVLPLPIAVQAQAAQDADAPSETAPHETAPDETEPPEAVTAPAPALLPNNIVGLNLARLHQERYIWAASDLINANGGDWGYITVVLTAEDRDTYKADLNLQVFLDRCYEFHVQPIIRVATSFDKKSGTWTRPGPDEPAKWRAFFERANWPVQRVWVVAGNEPNLGREWGGAVDAADYARYLSRFIDAFASSERFKVTNAPLDISNTNDMPKMQDALEFLAGMREAVPDVFERLGGWASNPYRVTSQGPGVRYTHLAYEAELEAIGRDLPVIITEAGHLETGDDAEIAEFYRVAFRDWMADPRVVAATPLFWHPDRNEYWMFELDSKGAFKYRSPTYYLLRTLPRVAGTPNYVPTLANTARPPKPPGADDAVFANVPADGLTRAAGEWPQRVHPPLDVSDGPDGEDWSSTVTLRVAGTNDRGASLRAGPDTSAPTLTVIPEGEVVSTNGEEQAADGRAWRLVRTPEGVEGWIAADFVVPTNE
ncbi:MAG: SH3 domain-containing protein [Chloroflexi bacterium]|nr:SH3 domain-containing protein [Chloroflexota bacterium]